MRFSVFYFLFFRFFQIFLKNSHKIFFTFATFLVSNFHLFAIYPEVSNLPTASGYNRSNTSVYLSFAPGISVNVFEEDNIWPGVSPDIRVGSDFKVFKEDFVSLDLYCGYQFSLYFPPEGRRPYFLYKDGMISFQKISLGSAIRFWWDASSKRRMPFFLSLGQQLSFPFDMRIFDKYHSQRLEDFTLPYYSFKLGIGSIFPFQKKSAKPFFQEIELLFFPRNTGAHCELRICVGVIVKEK